MSKIEWTDETWNPVTGCDRVSPGCDNCYALTMAKRLKAMGAAHYQNDGDPRTSGPGFGVTCHPDALDVPLRWRKPRRVFVNSMSDLFHQEVPYRFIRDVFNVMRCCDGGTNADGTRPSHTFQVLTKRPQRMAMSAANRELGYDPERPPANIWLGTSIESDRYAWRADHLRSTPAAVRFLSLEPLLGPVPSLDLTGIDWVIVGGESGHGARPMHPEWVRDIRDRCQAAGVRFFFKQWGEWVPYEQDPQPPFWMSQHGTSIDGHHLPAELTEGEPVGAWWAPDCLDEPVVYRKVGKKQAGRELDGRTWDEYPAETLP